MREKKLGRKVGEEKEKFSASNSEPSPSSVYFVSFQVSFGYEALMNYVLLVVRSETRPRTLKNSK
jgi:hypothetical protein